MEVFGVPHALKIPPLLHQPNPRRSPPWPTITSEVMRVLLRPSWIALKLKTPLMLLVRMADPLWSGFGAPMSEKGAPAKRQWLGSTAVGYASSVWAESSSPSSSPAR